MPLRRAHQPSWVLYVYARRLDNGGTLICMPRTGDE
jgi:hypothetical protein